MNLYIQFRVNKMPAHLIDAEGKIVGTLRDEVARWLIHTGTALPLNEKQGDVVSERQA